MITINYFHCMSSPQNLIFLGVYKQFPTLRYATVAVGHVWKSSVYIILLTLFCVIAPWKPDFQSFLNLSFSLGYSLRKLVVQESTAKCLSSRSVADGLVRRYIGIHLIKRVRFTHCRVNYYNNCDASFNLEFFSLCGDIPTPDPLQEKPQESVPFVDVPWLRIK